MGGFSDTREVVDPNRNIGYRKPGRPYTDGVEAAREVIAAEIGRWLQVDLPTFRLIPEHPEVACGVSIAVAETIIPYEMVMHASFTPPAVRSAGQNALPRLGRAIVLDALLGNCDRMNGGNIVFGRPDNCWYSLDYSMSYNVFSPAGVGEVEKPFGTERRLRQRYFGEIVDAVCLNSTDFRDTVALAESIKDEELEHLFALLPTSHVARETAGAMLAFVKGRRSSIRAIVRDWGHTVGITGIL